MSTPVSYSNWLLSKLSMTPSFHQNVQTNSFSERKMAADMDPEEMEEWRTIFNLFDVDGDESITCEVEITCEVKIKHDDDNQGRGKMNNFESF